MWQVIEYIPLPKLRNKILPLTIKVCPSLSWNSVPPMHVPVPFRRVKNLVWSFSGMCGVGGSGGAYH